MLFRSLGGPAADAEAEPGTDLATLADGKISVTPLHLDLTSQSVIDELRTWSWPWPPGTAAHAEAAT